MTSTAKTHFARLAVLAATLIWGTSFVVMKNTLDGVPPFFLLAFRFLVAGLILGVIFIGRMLRATKADWLRGMLTGLFLFAAYAFQTIGLQHTTPGKNAFLTSVYCILVPFLSWAVHRVRPDQYNLSAAFLCMIGVGLVSLDGSLAMGIGDVLTLICGFFFSVHLLAVASFSNRTDVFVLTTLQFLTSGVCSLLFALITNEAVVTPRAEDWFGLVYLALFATTAALLLQNIGQKYLSASGVAILLSLESVFGVLCSVMVYGERPTLRMCIGFAGIFAAVILSETKLSFLKRR